MAKLTIDIGAKIDKLVKGLKGSGKAVKDWGNKVKADVDRSLKTPKAIKPKMDNSQVKRKIKETDSLWKQFRKGVAKPISLTSLVGGIAGVGVALGAFLLKSVKLAAAFEKMTIAFTTMTGSTTKAKDLIAELIEFSKNTPFTPEQTQKAGKALLAFGVAAGDVTKTLRILGDISAGTGKDLSEMAIIFGQIRGAGRLMGQDLLQLITAGFNPLQEISKKTGRSMRELKDDMRNGAISFKMVEDAFKSATGEGGKFFNMMENQSKSLEGQLTILQGSVSDLMRQFGELSLPELKLVVTGVQEAVSAIEAVAEARKQIEGDNRENITDDKIRAENLGADPMNIVTGLGRGITAVLDATLGENALSERMKKGIANVQADQLAEGGISSMGRVMASDVAKGKAKIEAEKAEDEKAAEAKKMAADLVQAKIERTAQDKFETEMLDIEDAAFFKMDADLKKGDATIAKNKAAKDEDAFNANKKLSQDALNAQLLEGKDKAATLQKEIAGAFQPGGKIQSRLARIGGERTINVDRQIPQKQLDQLMAVNAGIKGLETAIKAIDGLSFPK